MQGQRLSFFLKILLVVVIIAIAALYARYETRTLLEGPVVTITYPKNGATVDSSLTTIEGTAKNITKIALNNRDIFVDTEGNFREQLLLAEGYNIIEVTAQDRQGRVATTTLELIYKE